MALTDDQLHAIMPGLSPTRRAEVLPFLLAAIAEFAIDSPARAAAFLAQLAHESGQLRFMEEIWGPTDAQRRYEPPSPLAAKLGNTEAGDGKRFKGRGPIQVTGRSNYHRFGDALGIDLLSEPGRASVNDLAFRIAGLFWQKNGLNELADQPGAATFQQITRRINGGLNGLEDRERFYAIARAVLGVVERLVTRGRGMPAPPEAPPFERGHEAIEELAPRQRARPARAPRKARKATRADKARQAARRLGSRRPARTPRKKIASKRPSAAVRSRARKRPRDAGRRRKKR